MSGILLPAVACCCADVCEYCECITPKQFRVTFSSVALCTGCVGPDEPGGNYAKWVDSPDPALQASYVLEQTGGCQWEYKEDVTGIWEAHDSFEGPDCTSVVTRNDLTYFEIVLLLGLDDPPLFNLTAYHWATFGAVAFSGNANTATPCGGTTIITNDEATCAANFSGYSWWRCGHAGGTASIVAV